MYRSQTDLSKSASSLWAGMNSMKGIMNPLKLP